MHCFAIFANFILFMMKVLYTVFYLLISTFSYILLHCLIRFQEPTSSDAIGKWPGKQIVLSSTPEMVKSTAVVKWSSSRQVVQFSKLSINTNLNDAPENWLRSRSYGEQYLRELPWRRRHFECTRFLHIYSFWYLSYAVFSVYCRLIQ